MIFLLLLFFTFYFFFFFFSKCMTIEIFKDWNMLKLCKKKIFFIKISYSNILVSKTFLTNLYLKNNNFFIVKF